MSTPTRQQVADVLVQSIDGIEWGDLAATGRDEFLAAADDVLALFGPSEAERAAWAAGFAHGQAAAERGAPAESTVMVELSRSDAALFAANVWADDPNERRHRLALACCKALGGNTDG